MLKNPPHGKALTGPQHRMLEAAAHKYAAKFGNRWIGVDLDGTLAKEAGKFDPDYIGDPIEEMVEYVKALLEEGQDVTIPPLAWPIRTQGQNRNG